MREVWRLGGSSQAAGEMETRARLEAFRSVGSLWQLALNAQPARQVPAHSTQDTALPMLPHTLAARTVRPGEKPLTQGQRAGKNQSQHIPNPVLGALHPHRVQRPWCRQVPWQEWGSWRGWLARPASLPRLLPIRQEDCFPFPPHRATVNHRR